MIEAAEPLRKKRGPYKKQVKSSFNTTKPQRMGWGCRSAARLLRPTACSLRRREICQRAQFFGLSGRLPASGLHDGAIRVDAKHGGYLELTTSAILIRSARDLAPILRMTEAR